MDARVHDGPDAPVVRLQWMYTDAPFLPLGTGCVVMNRIWDQDQETELRVGQLPVKESNFDQDARLALPVGFKSDHICHPEWLSTGEPYPNDLPPQEYTLGNMPLCCGWEPATRGGLMIGGSAGDVWRAEYTNPTSGGIMLGGSAGDRIRYPDATSGGIMLGGSAGDIFTRFDPTSGGIMLGGSAGDRFGVVDPAAGGIMLGGSAGDIRGEVDPAAGGIMLGGSTGDSYGPPFPPPPPPGMCPEPVDTCAVAASTPGLVGPECCIFWSGRTDTWRTYSIVSGMRYRWCQTAGAPPAGWVIDDLYILTGVGCGLWTELVHQVNPGTPECWTFDATGPLLFIHWVVTDPKAVGLCFQLTQLPGPSCASAKPKILEDDDDGNFLPGDDCQWWIMVDLPEGDYRIDMMKGGASDATFRVYQGGCEALELLLEDNIASTSFFFTHDVTSSVWFEFCPGSEFCAYEFQVFAV